MPSDIRLRLALFLAVGQRHDPKTLESAGAAMVRHFGPRVLRRHRRLLRHRRRRNQLLLYPFAEQNFDWRTADPKRQANALDFEAKGVRFRCSRAILLRCLDGRPRLTLGSATPTQRFSSGGVSTD